MARGKYIFKAEGKLYIQSSQPSGEGKQLMSPCPNISFTACEDMFEENPKSDQAAQIFSF